MLAFAVTAANAPASAAEADVTAAQARQSAPGVYQINVTVRHPDTGWDHYADRWEILDEAGAVLATRVLLHPHVNEQPFTRSLFGVTLPAGVTRIVLRAHDSVDGYGGATVILDLAE